MNITVNTAPLTDAVSRLKQSLLDAKIQLAGFSNIGCAGIYGFDASMQAHFCHDKRTTGDFASIGEFSIKITDDNEKFSHGFIAIFNKISAELRRIEQARLAKAKKTITRSQRRKMRRKVFCS